MYFILYLLIAIISSVFSFVTSGAEHVITNQANIKGWSMIPLGYYFVFYTIISYIVYRIKFKKISTFKVYLLRVVSKLNRKFNTFDDKVKFDKVELTPMQQKAGRIWSSLLKNKSTILSSSISTHTRSIQRDKFLISLRQRDGILTLMNTEMNLFYELFIPHKMHEELASTFDKEQEKRMNLTETEKRNELEEVLMNLI